MRLLPRIGPKIFELLAFTPLQYMLRAVEHSPTIGMVYTGEGQTPTSCVIRIGPLLFLGGPPADRCLSFIGKSILTAELREKYKIFYCYYADPFWQEALNRLFPGRGRVGVRSVYRAGTAPQGSASNVSGIVPITEDLMKSRVQNREMIENEVTTYTGFDQFLSHGIGYALVINDTIRGFCTSEYQSTDELAIGIEVAEEHQRKGYAGTMATAFARDAVSRGYTAYWECSADNTASIRTALSCGFEHMADYPVLYLNLGDRCREERAPEEAQVKAIAQRYLAQVQSARRVPEGSSTYVYRIRTPSGVCYARFLPEEASFAAEALAHGILAERGVAVPSVIRFEHREGSTGLSMMLTGEIAGSSLEQKPLDHAGRVLQDAGRQLALIHTVPVEGFGWIDRDSPHILKGEKESFRDYFTEYLENDLVTLRYYDFSDRERDAARRYMEEALEALDTQRAVLVHGDFDISHIFHSEGIYSGLIDFGEIRGNNRLFDLATFALFDKSPNRAACGHLLDGYRSVSQLTDADLRGIELMALSIVLRFAAKKVETSSRDYWYGLMKRQLARLG